jgi:Domain of unknown function (DUF4386)
MTTDMRKVALWGGVLYLITFVFSIPTLGLKEAVLDNADWVLGSSSENSVIWASIFDVICGLAGIGTAVALYPVTRRVSRSGAVGFLASRTLEAAVLFVGAISLLSIVTLRQDVAGSADPDSLITVGRSLVAVHDWSFLLGPGVIAAVNALFLATIMYRSGLVPRWIPSLGLVGAPLLLVSDMVVAFGGWEQVSGTALLLTLPIAVWDFSLGVYLTVKGFRPSPVLDDEPVHALAA